MFSWVQPSCRASSSIAAIVVTDVLTVTAVGRATGEGTGGGVPAFWGSAGSIMAVPSAPIITPTPNATTTRSWLFLGGLEITTSGIAPYIVRMVMNL